MRCFVATAFLAFTASAAYGKAPHAVVTALFKNASPREVRVVTDAREGGYYFGLKAGAIGEVPVSGDTKIEVFDLAERKIAEAHLRDLRERSPYFDQRTRCYSFLIHRSCIEPIRPSIHPPRLGHASGLTRRCSQPRVLPCFTLTQL